MSKIFRLKGFYNTLFIPFARYVLNTLENSHQAYFSLISSNVYKFSTDTSQHEEKTLLNNKLKTHSLYQYFSELSSKPKEASANILMHIQTAIQHSSELCLEFNQEDLQTAKEIVSKVKDPETREVFGFIFEVLEAKKTTKIITIERIFKIARNTQYKPLILNEISALVTSLLKQAQINLTDNLYEELAEFAMFVIPSKYFSKEIKDTAVGILPLLFEHNIKRGNTAANVDFLQNLIDSTANIKRGISSKETKNSIYDDFSDYTVSNPEKMVKSEQETKIKQIIANYKQALINKNQNMSIYDLHNIALANIILKENSESLWELTLPYFRLGSTDIKYTMRVIVAISESSSSSLITVKSAQDSVFMFYEKVKKDASNFSLDMTVSLMELFLICKMIDRDLFEILNQNIEAKFDQANFNMLSKIIWIYSELPVSFSFDMPKNHLYHLIKQEYKKLTPNQFINLLLRLIKLSLPNLKHDWKEFILLDGDLKALTINMLNNLKFQNLTESEKIKLLFLYKTLAKTALSGFINESTVKMKIKPLLSSFIAFHEQKSSGLQRNVEEILESMKINFRNEQIVDDIISLDLIVEENFCVEVNGPYHYYLVKQKNEQGVDEIYHMETRSTWMKGHLLEIMGYHYRSVKYYEWQVLGNNNVDKRQYLRKLLREN